MAGQGEQPRLTGDCRAARTGRWKFEPSDLDDRDRWDDDQRAYGDVPDRLAGGRATGAWCRRTGSGTATGPWPACPLAHLADLGLACPRADLPVARLRARLKNESPANAG